MPNALSALTDLARLGFAKFCDQNNTLGNANHQNRHRGLRIANGSFGRFLAKTSFPGTLSLIPASGSGPGMRRTIGRSSDASCRAPAPGYVFCSVPRLAGCGMTSECITGPGL